MRISDWSSDVCSSDLTDDLNDILQPFHWEAWKAALFSDHPDGWPDDDEQDAICQRVDSMAVGEHYQAWSEEVQEKIVSLFSHRLQSTAELRAKLKDANSLLSDWLKIGNNMAERRAIRDRARTFLARSEEHTSELQSLMRISYAVFCLKKKKIKSQTQHTYRN